MSAVLRFTAVMLLLASCAYGSAYYYPRGRRDSYSHNGYYGPRPNIYRQHRSYSKPACTAQTPCYKQLLVFTGDAIPEPSTPAAFVQHYRRAGYNRYAIIEEGKRAAQWFNRQYGIDIGYLPDDTYVAPNITLHNGMTLTFVTQVPPKRVLSVAAQRDSVQFINAPVYTAAWVLAFPKDFYSNGAFRGRIPAGSTAVFGSYIIEVCPHETYSNPCRSTLSWNPKGLIFIKFNSRVFHKPGIVDCDLVHAEWGKGLAVGASITDKATGVKHQRSVLTFPKSCDASRQCFTEPWG